MLAAGRSVVAAGGVRSNVAWVDILLLGVIFCCGWFTVAAGNLLLLGWSPLLLGESIVVWGSIAGILLFLAAGDLFYCFSFYH